MVGVQTAQAVLHVLDDALGGEVAVHLYAVHYLVHATTISFAKSNNTDVANAVKSVAELVKQAPSGTVYGVVENTKHHIVVKTPFGKYTIEKKDGGVSFMGISAKLVSAKNGVYQVKSSLGNFSVNTRKGTITKK